MQTFMESIFTVFDSHQASLIYYLLLSATLFTAILVNLHFWRGTSAGIPRRLVAGLVLMLLVELSAFTASALLGGNEQTGNIWLPPIDRFQMAFILIWLLWIWAFPESTIWADLVVIISTIGAMVALIITIGVWPTSASGNGFNTHWLDVFWQVPCLLFAILMVVIIYSRRQRLWGAGILTGLLFILGHTLQLIYRDVSANYPEPVRLVTLVALPLLLLLPQGYAASVSATHAAALRRGRDKRDRRRFSTELPTALGFLSLAWEHNPQTAMQLLVKSIGRALTADICLFTTSPNQNNQISILTGHDFFNHVEVKETRLDRQRIPMVIDAVNKQRTLRLAEDYSDTQDSVYLCRMARFNGTAPLLFHPVNRSNAWQVGGILLLTPYSRRAWTEDDSKYVAGLTEALLRIIEQNQSDLESASQIQKLTEEQRESGQIIINLQNELQELSTELGKFQTRIGNLDYVEQGRQKTPFLDKVETKPEPFKPRKNLTRDATIRLDPLVVEKHERGSNKELAKLKEENDALRQLIAHISAGPEEVDGRPMNLTERELRSSLEEVARLKNILADADMKLRQMQRSQHGGA